MTIITDDSSVEMGMVVDRWLADLRAEGFDDDALRQASSSLGQWAATSWQQGEEAGQDEILRQFVDWTRQQDLVLSWLDTDDPQPN